MLTLVRPPSVCLRGSPCHLKQYLAKSPLRRCSTVDRYEGRVVAVVAVPMKEVGGASLADTGLASDEYRRPVSASKGEFSPHFLHCRADAVELLGCGAIDGGFIRGGHSELLR